MKKVKFLLATCVALLFVTSMTALGQTKFIVVPGAVELSPQTVGLELPHQIIDPIRITGSVTLKEAQDGSDANTAQTGGGCLIYHLPKHRACTSDADCTIDPARGNSDGSGSQSGEKVIGYCAHTVNITDLNFSRNAKKRCWYQPDPESCEKKPDPSHPLLLNQSLEFDNSTPIHPPGVKGRISWRVVSCQNLKTFGCRDRIPNGFQYRYGLITEFQ